MSEKKRSLDSEKKRGYRIIASIEKIEEVDRGEDDPEVVIIYKKTIGTISGACNLNMKKNATTITLEGVDNVVFRLDPSVKLHVGSMVGGGSVKMKILKRSLRMLYSASRYEGKMIIKQNPFFFVQFI